MGIETSSPYNEALERGGEIRRPYRPLFEIMERLGPGMMAERHARAGEHLRRLGATFPLPGDDGPRNCVLPADWIPRDELGEKIRGLLIPED